jgi:transposase
LHEQLKAFYSDIGRPSVDPELMIRMLLAVTAMAFVMSAGRSRRATSTATR